jgi:prepilin peptidase CpaA
LPLTTFSPVVVAVAAAGVLSAAIDLRTRRLPNPLTLGLSVGGVVLAATGHGAVTLTGALIGFVVGLVVMLPGHVIGATGAGDVKLFAAFGTFLGPKVIAIAFLYTAIAGGVLAVVVALARGSLALTVMRTAAFVQTGGGNAAEIEHVASNNRFAYAPAIALGTLVAALGM